MQRNEAAECAESLKRVELCLGRDEEIRVYEYVYEYGKKRARIAGSPPYSYTPISPVLSGGWMHILTHRFCRRPKEERSNEHK